MKENKKNVVELFLAAEECRMGINYYTHKLQLTRSEEERKFLTNKIERYKYYLPIFEAELEEINAAKEAEQ